MRRRVSKPLQLLALSVLPAAALAANTPFIDDPAAAFDRASGEGRPVVIDFYTTWCKPCEEMARTTWRDTRVLAALDAYAECLGAARTTDNDALRRDLIAVAIGVDSDPWANRVRAAQRDDDREELLALARSSGSSTASVDAPF